MKILGFIVGAFFIVGGFSYFGMAKSAIHEILGAVTLLTGCVCIAVASVIDAIHDARRRQKEESAETLAATRELTAAVRTQTEVLTTLLEAVQQNERTVMHLKNLEQLSQHTNSLLEWMGEMQGLSKVRA